MQLYQNQTFVQYLPYVCMWTHLEWTALANKAMCKTQKLFIMCAQSKVVLLLLQDPKTAMTVHERMKIVLVSWHQRLPLAVISTTCPYETIRTHQIAITSLLYNKKSQPSFVVPQGPGHTTGQWWCVHKGARVLPPLSSNDPFYEQWIDSYIAWIYLWPL